MKRREIKKMLETRIEELAGEAQDVEDLHEYFTELVVDLEGVVKQLYERMYEKEGKKAGVALIRKTISEGKNSLVLRADGLSKQQYALALEKLKRFKKELDAEISNV